ncbi:proline-rich protein 2-like isoform X2 [Suricata suricatta]|uniref:proline-rich protein 2-like isoform X2 n=1 Tax=Suricata suricatta TaxID=37032 RepID=UPI0011555CB9|nr:proline-rich protein 2-like isoform X2 [Suricata suricatta]
MPMRGCSAKAPPTPGGQAGWSTTNSTQPGPAPPLSPQSHARAGPAPERRRESPPPPRAPGLRSPPPPARRFTPLRPPPPSHIHTPPARLLYGKPRRRLAESHPQASTLLEEAEELFTSHWRTPHIPPRAVSATGPTSRLPPSPVIALEGYPWLSRCPRKRLKRREFQGPKQEGARSSAAGIRCSGT